MAVKVASQGVIPSIDLDHLQFKQLNIAVSQTSPYRTSVSGKTILYGKDANGTRYYDKTERELSIPDLDAMIAGLSSADQVIAAQAMANVQGGLGVLAQLAQGIEFVAVD